MIIVWKGLGPLVVPVFVAQIIFANIGSFLLKSMHVPPLLAQQVAWGALSVLTAFIVWTMAMILAGAPRPMVDGRTGRQFIRQQHEYAGSLYYVPMHFWAIFPLGLGALMVFWPNFFD